MFDGATREGNRPEPQFHVGVETKRIIDNLLLEEKEKSDLIMALQKGVDLTLQVVQKIPDDRRPEVRGKFGSTGDQIERQKLNSSKLSDGERALLEQRLLVVAITKLDDDYRRPSRYHELNMQMRGIYEGCARAEWYKVESSRIRNWFNSRRYIGPKDEYNFGGRLELLEKIVEGIFYGPSEAIPLSSRIERGPELTASQRRLSDLAALSSSGLADHEKSQRELAAEGLRRVDYNSPSVAASNVLAKNQDLAERAKDICEHIIAIVAKCKTEQA